MATSKAIVKIGLLTGALLGHIALAGERTPYDARNRSVKEAKAGTRVITESERPLKLGYSVHLGQKEVVFSIGGESDLVSYQYRAVKGPVADVHPQNFVRMWGTSEGMSAIARALSDMLSNEEQVNVRRIDLPGGVVHTRVDGAALFEDDGITHLLVVRFEDDEVIFEDIVGVATDCTASPPGSGGRCSCTGHGTGSSCSSGTNPETGESWAKCKDAPSQPSPGVANCKYSGSGGCECISTAAD